MVVPVLMMSCHVSEKWKVGPVKAQTMMIRIAPPKAQALPRTLEELRAKTRKASRTTQKKSRSFSCSFSCSVCVLFTVLLLISHKTSKVRAYNQPAREG